MDPKDYEVPRNPVVWGMFSLLCGVAGVIIVQLTDFPYIGAALGAIGLIVGGFSTSIAYHFPSRDKMQYVGFSAAGILASVIAFMFGLVFTFT